MKTVAATAVHYLIAALDGADVLEAFCRLRQEDQQNFSRWIGRARDDGSRRRRLEALVLALRESPLQPHRSLKARFSERW